MELHEECSIITEGCSLLMNTLLMQLFSYVICPFCIIVTPFSFPLEFSPRISQFNQVIGLTVLVLDYSCRNKTVRMFSRQTKLLHRFRLFIRGSVDTSSHNPVISFTFHNIIKHSFSIIIILIRRSSCAVSQSKV